MNHRIMQRTLLFGLYIATEAYLINIILTLWIGRRFAGTFVFLYLLSVFSSVVIADVVFNRLDVPRKKKMIVASLIVCGTGLFFAASLAVMYYFWQYV